jgi:hypothetical protein
MLMATVASQAATITLYLKGSGVVPQQVEAAAMVEVSRIFSGIGVQLTWTHSEPAPGAIVISVGFSDSVPARVHPGAIAFSTPFAGKWSAITVLYDRLAFIVLDRPSLAPHLLAYALAHEIGHVLMRTDVHRTSGLMKAHWTTHDFDEMARCSLSFTRLDVEMMMEGLRRR